MAFGENYQPVYTAPQLEDGEYRARIVTTLLGTYPSGDEYAAVKVEYAGKAGYGPNLIFLNSAPKIGQVKANGQQVTQKDVDRVNRQITTFFECFGIPVGDFDFAHWKGRVGTVRIAPQYDKDEPDHKSKSFKAIYPQKPKADGQQPAAAQPQQAQTPPPPDPTPANASPTASGEFPEDIPF